jgi:5-methylcytosine-specific restriction endonuclease McrA
MTGGRLSARTARIKARRAFLLLQMGGKCAHCPNTIGLQFDCKIPRGHWHHVTGSSQRQSFYEAEFQAGNLQLLCAFHHKLKTNLEARQRRSRSPHGSSPMLVDSLTSSNL